MGINFLGNGQTGPDLPADPGAGDNPNAGTTPGEGAPVSQEGGPEGDAGEIPKYHDQFSDDLKGHKSLTKFQTVSDLGRSYVELEGKMGGMIAIPGEEASDEELAAFRGKLGIPESPDKYDLSLDEGFPDYVKTGLADSEESLRKHLHNAGVSQEAAQVIYGWLASELKAGGEALNAVKTKRQNEAEAALKAKWGDSVTENKRIMEDAVNAFGTDEFKTRATEEGWVNDPVFMETFYQIGLNLKEDSFLTGGKPRPDTGGLNTGAKQWDDDLMERL